MHAVISALAFASALSAIFAFRFRPSRPVLAMYFAGFAGIEWTAHTFFLPEGAVPIEAAFVLFGIAVLFGILVRLQERFESAED